MLSDKSATLSGVVLGPGGAPARIAQVMLAPASRELERVSRLVKGTVSGAGGSFRFEGVAPGQYVVLAFEDAEPGLAEDPEFRAEFAARGRWSRWGRQGTRRLRSRRFRHCIRLGV